MHSIKKLIRANQQLKVLALIAVCFYSITSVFAQGRDKYPVEVSVFINSPYSVYLSDYISRGSNKLTAQLVFNDFNEASRTVYLKVRIESPNLRITTKEEFVPVKSITLLPGIPYSVSGDELQEYFDFNNIAVAGMSKSEFSGSCRLIEGNYTFCFEVYDYISKEQISLRKCATANIRLYEAPRLVTPVNETVFPVNVPQNINFQWQLTEAQNLAPDYKIHIFELPDVKIAPDLAIGNNQAIKVFESPAIKTTYFLYDASSPLLQRGKKYAWCVQALQQGNRNEFKNNGYSRAGSFYYGYPENGSIVVDFPKDKYSFSLRDEKFFRWNAPDNLTKNQQYYYDYKLVAVQPNQTDSDAILNNAPVYTTQSPLLTQTYSYDILVNKKFESNTTYAWQVKAHTGDQNIASSKVNTFFGPPLLEAFYAGNHVVFINKAQGTLSDLSGEGEVKVTSTGVTEKVYFSHITIGKSGALYVLTQGTVKGKYNLPPLGLNAEYTPNGTANFMADSVICTSAGLFLKGFIKWNFPHPTITPNPAFITSKTAVVDYNSYWLLGIIPLTDSLKYQLADPYGFDIELTPGSDIVLRGRNNYYPRLNGLVTMPRNVKDVIGKRVKLPFTNAHKLDFITESNVQAMPSVDLLDNSRLYLQPVSYTFDFSETESMDKLANDKEWKGIYLSKSNFIFDNFPDKNNQIIYKKSYSKTIDASVSGTDSCWITTLGLQFNSTKTLDPADSVWFNKFPSFITNYRFEFRNSIITNSYLKGKLKIPLISEIRDFTYTVPLSERGFQFGYLDEDLDGIAFVYNEAAGEQKINIKINKAVFADKERLDMNIDFDWPALGISLTNLDGFRVWGNTEIGFMNPNGMYSLSYQVNGKLKGFPITANVLGAGSAPGLYAFGFKADVVMSADLAGPAGPPVVNIYSIYNNKLLGDYARFNQSLTPAAAISLIPQAEQGTGLLDSLPGQGTDLTQLQNQINDQLNFSHADIIDNAKSMIETGLGTSYVSPSDSTIANTDSTGHVKLLKLTPVQLEVLQNKSQLAARILIAKYANGLNNVGQALGNKIDSITLTINSAISNTVYTIVDSMAARVAKNVNDNSIKQTLFEVASVTKDELAGNITSNISAFSADLKENLNPANALSLVIGSVIEAVVQDIVEKGIEDVSINELTEKAEESLSKSIDLLGKIPEQLAARGSELIRSLDPNVIFENLLDALKEYAFDKAKQLVAEKAAEAVSSIIGGEAGEAIAQYIESFPMDMDAIGEKFKGEALKEIVADPVSISLQTKIVSLAGYIQFSPNDPDYGNVWRGDITATLKVPVKFSFNVAYLVGKKDSLNYWFCQVRPPSAGGSMLDSDKKSQSTALTDKRAYPLDNPITLGPVELVGISGRLYSHMEDDGTTILPSANIDYGAFLNVVLFDSKNHGKTFFLNVATEYIVTPDDEFVFDFYGKCMVRASSPSVEGNDCDAVGKGEVHFNYNSSKHHLVGSGSLEINSTGKLCAKGSFAVDVQPGKWYLAIGNRDNRIIFIPGCMGWSPTGWLIVDQNTAELGLGLQYSINAKVGFDIGIVALAVRVDAGVAVGIMVKIQYNPDFKLMDAGIWAEIWAKVVVDYKINLLISVRGSITLIDLYASANLIMHFYPPPKTIKGDVKGYLKLCGIVSCNFNASFEKQI